MIALRHLTLDISDNDDGVVTIEALASLAPAAAARHTAALAEAHAVLDWAWRRFPDAHAPADEGGQWDHDLQDVVEADGWRSIALTLTGTAEFALAFAQAFADGSAD